MEDPLAGSFENTVEEADPSKYASENSYTMSRQSVLFFSFVFLSGVVLGALVMQSYILKNNASMNISTAKLRRPEL